MAPFDEVLAHFWDRDESYGVGPPLTDAAISEAERRLGVRLPPDYLALMRVPQRRPRRRRARRAPARPAGPVGDGLRLGVALGRGPDGEPSVMWSDTEGPFEQAPAPTFRALAEGLRPRDRFPAGRPSQAALDANAPTRRRFWRRRRGG